MKRSVPSRRGLFLLSILGVSLVGVLGVVLAFILSGEDGPIPLSESKRLALLHEACAEERWPQAETHLQPLLQSRPDDIDLQLIAGRVWLELGRLLKARDLFNKIHKERPEKAEAIVGLGQVHEAQGELDHAIACYRRATEMRKENGGFFRLLGLAQVKKGDSMAAMFSIRQSLKFIPGQEDLSKLLNDIGMARQPRIDAPRRPSSPFDPFEDRAPRSPGFPGGLPGPSVPDPAAGLPRPGGGRFP